MPVHSNYKTLQVTPLSPALGAEISGVDIVGGISDAQFAELRQAFTDYAVIFLRDQDITPEQHIAFAEGWGKINVNRFFKPTDDYPVIAEVRKEADQKANIGSSWHTDHSYDQCPAMGSILYAREVPSVGGDTLFASMYAAYEALSDGLKQMLSTLRAEHPVAMLSATSPTLTGMLTILAAGSAIPPRQPGMRCIRLLFATRFQDGRLCMSMVISR